MPGACRYACRVATGWVWRHVAQVVTAVVTSKENTSARSPAVALPSRGAGFISLSCWSESFGLHPGRLVTEVDEGGADGFDERRRSADVAAGSNLWWPADLVEQFAVDPTVMAAPRRRLLAGEGEGHGSVPAVGQRLQLVPVDHLVEGASGVHELHRRCAGDAAVVAHH